MEASKRSIIGRLAAAESSAIHVDQARCAKVRNRNVECLKCAQACTSGCISLVDGELVVDASKCVGCGTCATVCPTCALEARNPTDAQLMAACVARVRDGEVVVMCSQLKHAVEELVDEGSCADVVCLGRVDESLLCSLAAQGAQRVVLACGDCAQCAQKPGRATACVVAGEARALLDAWGSGAVAVVEEGVPASVLAEGASPEAARAAMRSYFSVERACHPLGGDGAARAQHASFAEADEGSPVTHGPDRGAFVLPHVMKDGTLPHFVPDRRERLLDALASLGEPKAAVLSSRLWGCVAIDGTKCSSCRMCATFCPTGAIRKFDDEDGTKGVLHYPGDCVKCGSCRDICPEGAIVLHDEVRPSFVLDGAVHRYVMKERPVKLDDPHQIHNTMKQYIEGDVFER